MNNNSKDYGRMVYFAAVEDPKELAAGIQEKITQYRNWCKSRGLVGLWKKKLSNYYGVSLGGNTSQAVTSGGSEGELSMIKVNDLHNLIQNQLVLVTGQRPAGIARAINSDSSSLKDARIGTAVAEHYMASVGWEQKFVNAAETALLVDEAYTLLGWDKDDGDPIAVDQMTGKPEMSGDLVMSVHCPWNVARDMGMEIEANTWNVVSFKGNRFDYAAKFPKFRNEILMCPDDNMGDMGLDVTPPSSDAISLHLLVHDRTAALPHGRYSLMIGDSIVMDLYMPFPDYPLRRMAAEDVIDGCMGYSPSNDIMALEEVTDGLHSIATTNAITFGGQCLVAPEGIDLNHTELAKGVRLFKLPPDQVDKLKALDLLHTSPEIFEYIKMLTEKKSQQVGVNSVTQGNPSGALAGASGSALALIAAQAIAFNSGTQRSYFALLSDTMTSAIGILRVYADTPRMARIVGKAKASGLKEFKWTGDDLSAVSSIVYEVTNALSQTMGGRLTMAQDLLKMPNQVISPKQYLTVATTGNLDCLTEDAELKDLLILEENEWLNEGKQFKAVITQNHSDHINSHTAQITLEMQMSDPNAVATILAHIQDHVNLWGEASQTNPGILIATGQQPLPMPPPPPMMGPPPGQGAPGPAPGPQGPTPMGQVHSMPVPAPKQIQGPHSVPPPMAHQNNQLEGNGLNSTQQKAATVRQPNMPIVAGTHQRAVVPGVAM